MRKVRFNLRLDPFERCAFTECPPQMFQFYGHEFWRFVFVQQEVAKLGETAIEFPPMQAPASFNLSKVRDRPTYSAQSKSVVQKCLAPTEGSVRRGSQRCGRSKPPSGP
jgi:arylsulfatase